MDTYEKKYKEAQGWIEKIYPTLQHEQQMEAEAFFPELAESEDERIRKELIVWLKNSEGQTLPIDRYNAALAWLEKQGEQKPADKVEPKFHEGEWVTNGDYTWKIIDVEPLDYILQSQDGNIVDDTISHVDEQFNLWTIQDAKDGDVLYSLDSNRPFIYKERNGYEQAKAYCGLNIYGKFFVSGTKDCVITLDKYVPATKEQRDTLERAITNAGYRWDRENLKLKKI